MSVGVCGGSRESRGVLRRAESMESVPSAPVDASKFLWQGDAATLVAHTPFKCP